MKIFFLETENIELNIDVIELVFRVFFKLKGRFPNNKVNDAINELNDRFKEHAVGYQFEEGKIIRVDSTYMHSEVVKPTIWLLSHPKFTGANNEFLNAHEHYRSGRNKECLISCTKAIESTMKIICEEKGWEYDRQKDTLAKLVQICFNNGLLPEYIQNQFTSLPSLLSTGVSVIRNKTSAHGDGVYPQSVDDDLTRYGLNLTGSNIIFLIKQSKLI